jgi:hypothetical protein
MEKTEQDLGKLETQLKQWGAKLDEFVAKADRAGTAARIDNRKRIDELKAKVKVRKRSLTRSRPRAARSGRRSRPAWRAHGTISKSPSRS